MISLGYPICLDAALLGSRISRYHPFRTADTAWCISFRVLAFLVCSLLGSTECPDKVCGIFYHWSSIAKAQQISVLSDVLMVSSESLFLSDLRRFYSVGTFICIWWQSALPVLKTALHMLVSGIQALTLNIVSDDRKQQTIRGSNL